MKVSLNKGQHPRYPILRQAYKFDDVMGCMLSHLRATNSAEISQLRGMAGFVNHFVYQAVKATIPVVDRSNTLEELLAHNDTISWLRTRHTKTSKKIANHQFGYPKESL